MQGDRRYQVHILVPDEDSVVLALEGDVTGDVSQEIEEVLSILVDQESQRVIVDLTEVSRLGAASARTLAAVAARASEAVSIICANRSLLALLREAGVDRVCPLFSSMAAAVAQLRKASIRPFEGSEPPT